MLLKGLYSVSQIGRQNFWGSKSSLAADILSSYKLKVNVPVRCGKRQVTLRRVVFSLQGSLLFGLAFLGKPITGLFS